MSVFDVVDTMLARNGGDRDLNELVKILAKHGYGKSDSQETPTVFAHRVDNAIRNCDNRFHKEVHEVLKNAGYSLPRALPPSRLSLDLSTLPVPLQEVFKVFADNMLCGLQKGEKRRQEADPLEEDWLSWDEDGFTRENALALALRNLAKGQYADAANFLMFMCARGWSITEDMLPFRITVSGTNIPLMRPESKPPVPPAPMKRPNTAFYQQTHGRDVSDSYISRLKDELTEGKLHWVRSVRGYDDLFNVLALAYDQAARGKGKERHANDKPFNQQPLMQLADKFGTGFLLGQASKKLEECTGLPYGQDVKEILGAIVYSCAAVMHLELEAERNSRPDSFEDDI
ncbi:hypothetical protein AB6J89_004719 [Salmonella enterica]